MSLYKPLFQNNHDTIQIRVHDTPLDKIDKTTTEKKRDMENLFPGCEIWIIGL
jgi:hypothetical protein